MLEFVDSDLYFVQDTNTFKNQSLQVGSGSGEKSTGAGGPKFTGSGSSSLHFSVNSYLDPYWYTGVYIMQNTMDVGRE